MKKLIYISLIFLLFSCENQERTYDAGNNSDLNFKVAQVRIAACVDFLNVMNGSPDNGGTWTWVTVVSGSTLTNADLIGDNPNVCFDTEPCGQYVAMYSITVDCTATLTINVACCTSLQATITCN